MGAFEVTNENYFSSTIMNTYWSVSQFKVFDKCQAQAMAELRGEYQREPSTALLVGSYVDAYFSDELDFFYNEHPEVFNSRTGELKADYRHADEVIAAINRQPVMVDYLTGEKQVIRTGHLFGVDWKIKMDVYRPDERIVDLKVMKDFGRQYKEGAGMVDWVQYWGYDIQGAIYQKIEQISSGRKKPLPFFLAAATKEKVPDVALIEIPQYVLDAALKVVESKIDTFDLVKTGDIKPERCEHCDWCKQSRLITKPKIYVMEAE